MQTGVELFGEQRIDMALAVDTALAGECRCNHDDVIVGFAALSPAAMTGVTVRFVFDPQYFGLRSCSRIRAIRVFLSPVCGAFTGTVGELSDCVIFVTPVVFCDSGYPLPGSQCRPLARD